MSGPRPTDGITSITIFLGITLENAPGILTAKVAVNDEAVRDPDAVQRSIGCIEHALELRGLKIRRLAPITFDTYQEIQRRDGTRGLGELHSD